MSYSVSDFIRFSKSPFELWCTKVNKLVDEGKLEKKYYINTTEENTLSEYLKEKAEDHEIRLKDYYRFQENKEVKDFGESNKNLEKTLSAINNATPVIYQGYIESDLFRGIPDFLVLDNDGKYFIVDAKLSKEIQTKHKLQILCYAEILTEVLGYAPTKNFIYLHGDEFSEIEIEDTKEIYEEIKKEFLIFMDSFDYSKPPLPKKHELANNEFAEEIKKIWFEENLLEQINGIWTKHVTSLNKNEIITLEDLISHKGEVEEINNKTLEKYKTLAVALEKSKENNIYVQINDQGIDELKFIPEKREGDLYIDFEGYPFMDNFEKFEYMYGYYINLKKDSTFNYFWCDDYENEKDNFNEFIEFLVQHKEDYPDANIYHYNHYEPKSLEYTAKKYNQNLEIISKLINARFIDLLIPIRKSFILGLSSNSLKSIEKLLNISREDDLQTGGGSMIFFENYYFGNQYDLKDEIIQYNKQDCITLEILHEWLLLQKTKL